MYRGAVMKRICNFFLVLFFAIFLSAGMLLPVQAASSNTLSITEDTSDDSTDLSEEDSTDESDPTTEEKAAQTVTIDSESVSLTYGKSTTLSPSTDGDGALVYKSSDTSVATVSTAGKVTAKAVGTATITIYAQETDSYAASESITVEVTVGLAKTTISSVTNTSTGMTIKYSKVSGASGYYIYRKTGSDGTYKKVGTVTSGSTLSFTDTGAVKSITSGNTYYYKIKAYSGSTTSSYCTAKKIKYLSAAKVTKVSNSSGKAKVTWKKVTGASGYYIYRKTASGEYEQVKKIKSGDTTTWTDSSVSKNTKYRYYVRAYSGSTLGAKANTKLILIPKATSITSTSVASGKIVVKWKKTSSVTGYQIQYATNSSFTKNVKTKTVSDASTVSKTLSGLTNGTTYYVRVRSYKTISGTKYYSTWSSKDSCTPRAKCIVFAGDSITTGLYASSYNGISKMTMSGTKYVVAKGSLNSATYQTSTVFNGSTGVSKLISYKPTRVYIMLGMNEVTWKSTSAIKTDYTNLIKKIQNSCPDVEIVVLALSPVTKAKASSITGFKKVGTYNATIKEVAEANGCYFYDYTADFVDSSGYLKTSYCGGDGIHWSATAYAKFGELITAYDKALDGL